MSHYNEVKTLGVKGSPALLWRCPPDADVGEPQRKEETMARANAKAGGTRPAVLKLAPRAPLAIVRPRGPAGAPWSDTLIETSHAVVAVRQTLGQKLPVLLLHGNSSSKDVFRHQMESRIGAQYRLIAMDFPGHGASGAAREPLRSYNFRGYADVALEVLEKLGIDHAVVLGWSLGGHVGLEMMTSFPGMIGLMVTGAPPVGNTIEAIQAGFRPHPHLGLTGRLAFSDEEVDQFKAMTLGSCADADGADPVRRTDGRARALMFEHLLAGKASDQKRIAETSTIPLAVVNGADDPLVDTGYLTGLAFAKLWDRRCYLIPRTGHAPFLEAPEVFNQILARFLKRMEGRLRSRLAHGSLCFSG